MTIEKKNLIPDSLLDDFDWTWFQSLLKSASPLFKQDDLYVTLSNYLDGKKFLYSRSRLVDELTTMSQKEFVANFPCSFRLTNVQILDSKISKMCKELERNFRKPVTCNLYFTPAKDKKCFDYHSDIQETYVIQLMGSKEWSFPLNEKNEPIICVKDMTFKNTPGAFNEEMKVILNEGDQLYASYALAHDVNHQGDLPSIHLTFATFEKQTRLVSDSFFGLLLKSIDMEDKQFEKLESEDVRKIVGLLKRAAFSISGDELALKIENEIFIENINVAKRGRPYPSLPSDKL